MPPRKSTRSKTRQRVNEERVEPAAVEQVAEKPTEEDSDAKTMVQYIVERLEMATTPQRFVQVMGLLFIINLFYLYNIDDADAKENLITVGLTLLGLLTQVAVIFNHQFKQYSAQLLTDEPDTAQEPQFPDFDMIYAVLLPLLVCLVTKPSYLPFVVGSVCQVTGMADLPKLLIAVAAEYQAAGIEDRRLAQFLAAPVLHLLISKGFGFYAGSSLSNAEKQMFSTLLVSLVFGVDSYSQITMVILQKLSIALVGCLVLYTPVYKMYLAQPGHARTGLLTLLYLSFSSTFFFASVYQLKGALGQHPLTWLNLFFQQGDRLRILGAWLISLVLLVPLVFRLSPSWALDTRRKVWHFTIVAILTYPLVSDPFFVSLALIGVIGLFVLIELLRALRLPPLGPFIADSLDKFRDERDKNGPLVISYIFLLLGIALPLFWSGNASTEAAVSGLISVGLGDASASLVGTRFGRHHWWDSKKSAEGTIAFVIVSTLTLAAFDKVAGIDYSVPDIAVACVIAAGLEAVSDINDNIVVPTVMFITLSTLKSRT
ncbi:unnamed protein product [Kuraishia capsulata CBS 1993]|uniref:dolichol kinase n=1 Tax=Kuraishia capsulata CBS 1993 TaxID=1382522 RepID=W6MIS4_9ASCO|nr:uncharacterized protein KUCA_T00001808001 [Kuraishia capsulata CBS 1993]CDK25838.1 unnamed protein product [Kuraishia capsulata CBS 1993]